MSDLYDSLEDDSDENKSLSESLNLSNTESFLSDRTILKCGSTDNYSFFLNPKVNLNLPTLQNGKTLPEPEAVKFNFQEVQTFLPKIEKNSRGEGLIKVSNVIVDCKTLNEKGLQLNNDGSFTKSPRQEKEELPFITREYRNLQLQKKKTYTLNKKILPVKSEKKMAPEKSENGACLTLLPNGKKNKGLNEESGINTQAGFQPSPNLTDSMKEKILKSYREKNSKTEKTVKKGRTSYSETTQQISHVSRKNTNTVKSEEFSKKGKNSLTKEKTKTMSKQNLDILLKFAKPKLNYSERHQLGSGFKPFYLRYGYKRVPVDTNRSNFGDSEVEELPEISSRVVSADNLRNDDEERFYKKIMQRDKQKETQHSSRSDGPLERLQLQERSSVGNGSKGPPEISGRSNFRCKRNTKSMFIDLLPDTDRLENTSKKHFHFCSINSSPNMSKIELAQKAKTYGYLVNARNICKLKAQSEGKSMATERVKTLKLNEKEEKKTADSSLPSRRLIKQNSLPVNVFPRVKADSTQNAGNIARASASLCKPKQDEEGQKGFVLPQVSRTGVREGSINAKAFERLSFSLKTPNA